MANISTGVLTVNLSDVTMATNTSHVTMPYPFSWSEILEINAPAALAVDRVISPIWYVLGIIGNPISTRIWLGRKMRKSNSSAIYLGTLAVVHFIFLFFHLFLELHLAWNVSTINHPGMCELFNFLYITPQYFAPFLVLSFTVERYIAVCHPFYKEKFCTVSRAVWVCVGLFILSVILGSLQAYIWTYNWGIERCEIRNGAVHFYSYWTWVTEILIFGIVPVVMLIFNVLVIKEIRRLTTQGAISMPGQSSASSPASTVTLLSVSFYYICTLLPATIVYSLQSAIPTGSESIPPHLWSTDPAWNSYFTYITVRKVVEEICLSNYASYIIIYYITGPYFRRRVNEMMHMDKCTSLVKKSPSQTLQSTHLSEYTLVQSIT
jgi:hypothetical protein